LNYRQIKIRILNLSRVLYAIHIRIRHASDPIEAYMASCIVYPILDLRGNLAK